MDTLLKSLSGVFEKSGGVGPKQALEFMGQFRKKEALFKLRMAILGSKLP
jgi:hypothetical protein